MIKKPVLLAVTPTVVWPVGDGISLRIHHLLAELTATWRVVLVADDRDGGVPPEVQLAEYTPLVIKGAWRTLPSQYDTKDLIRVVSEWEKRCTPRGVLLWAGCEFLAWEVLKTRAVVDRIDCAALTTWRGLRSAHGPRELARGLRQTAEMGWYERQVVRRTGATVVVGESDAAALGWISGRPEAINVISNGVAVGPAHRAPTSAPTVVFTGTLNYEPNVTAAVHLVRDIWPAVHTAVPEASLIIAGRSPTPEVQALEGNGVQVRANVASMEEIFDGAWVAAAPMRSGSGVKNKVLEAWAAGLPVVMSTTATNGLEIPPGHERLVADANHAAAVQLIALLKNPAECERLGKTARSFVTERYAWRAAAERLSKLLSP